MLIPHPGTLRASRNSMAVPVNGSRPSFTTALFEVLELLAGRTRVVVQPVTTLAGLGIIGILAVAAAEARLLAARVAWLQHVAHYWLLIGSALAPARWPARSGCSFLLVLAAAVRLGVHQGPALLGEVPILPTRVVPVPLGKTGTSGSCGTNSSRLPSSVLVSKDPLTSSMSALARLDAFTEELAALRAELAAEKDRRRTSRRWVIGAVIAAAAATSAIVTAVTTIIIHVH
jgi:hypothetical protein